MRDVLSGKSWRDAGSLANVSATRAMQIVHKIMRLSINPALFDGMFPDDNRGMFDIKQMRDNAVFWNRQADCVAEKWGLRQHGQESNELLELNSRSCETVSD